MAVTTGKETGTTSNGSSSKPSGGGGPGGGGPGGGSLQAPNRTAPSTGAGPQSNASKTTPTSTSAPGKTDKATPAPTSAPGKTDKVGTSEGPEKKPGLAGIQSARQQAAFDKQKDLYTQAGGASTSMRGPSGQKESAKVVDPSRGPNRGIASTSTNTTRTATGKTDNTAKQPTSNVADKNNREPGPSVAQPQGGIFSRGPNRGLVGTNTSTAKTTPGKTDNIAKQPQSNLMAKGNPQQSLAPGKTDKAPSPTVARPTNESFIDSLVNKGPALGAYNATGSILGMQPTRSAPSLGQVISRDPISVTGPRAGTTPSVPSGQPGLDTQLAISQLQDNVQRAQQGTLLGQYAAPQPKIADRVPQAPAAPAGPSMPDPRLAARQEQFERIKMGRGQVASVPQSLPNDPATPPPQAIPSPIGMKMVGNPTLSPTNPFGAYNPVAAGRLATLQTRIGVDDALSGPVPPAAAPPAAPPAAPTVPTRQGQITNPMYRDPMAQAQAVRAAVALGLGNLPQQAAPQPQFQNASQPMEVDIPGYPAQVAPSQEGLLGGNVFNRGQSPRDLIDAVNIASDKVRGVGGDVRDVASPTPTPSGAEAISPSQEGSYPPDDNFMQDDGQPQSLGELSNRYDYEKGLVKEGLTELPGRLWAAITSGDIRGYTPETNDKRGVNPPSMNQRPQQPLTDADAVVVARLLALLKELEQQGGSQAQADLVNSTFI